MECMEARALKPSLRRELAMKSTQQVLLDDLLCLNGPNYGVSSSEDFSVECFLDLSNGEFDDGSTEEEEEESQERVDDDNNSNSCSLSSDSFLTSELSVPADDIAELEWVSHFVDDSLSELSLLCPAGKVKSENHQKPRPEPEPVVPVLVKRSCFSSTVPAKARTKRARPGTTGWVWSLGSLPLTETSIASTTTTSSSSSGFNSTPCLIFTNMFQNMDGEQGERKRKKKLAVQPGGLTFQRRCSHCQVQKTPQWRTGPLGAKTLCNACGVRYKSGRLFPEYRPACSPTFSGEVHSNSHRKVLELRKKRESVEPASSVDRNGSEVIEAF